MVNSVVNIAYMDPIEYWKPKMLLDGLFFFNLTPRKEVIKGILIPPKKGGKSTPKNHLHFAGASFFQPQELAFFITADIKVARECIMIVETSALC